MAISGTNSWSLPLIPTQANQQIVESKNIENSIVSVSASTTKEMVVDYFADTPIMAEIARCESQFRHYDADDEVIRGEINPFDVGVMQINEKYHSKKAQELGIDLYTLEGNLAYAKYLYEKQGVRPWMASSKCWTKNQIAMRDN